MIKRYFQHRKTLVPSPSLMASLNSNRNNPNDNDSIAYSLTRSEEVLDEWGILEYETLQNSSHTFLATVASSSKWSWLLPVNIIIDKPDRSSTFVISIAAERTWAVVTSSMNSSQEFRSFLTFVTTFLLLITFLRWNKVPPSYPEHVLYKRFHTTYTKRQLSDYLSNTTSSTHYDLYSW
jgi:hypothetical protein